MENKLSPLEMSMWQMLDAHKGGKVGKLKE